MGVGKGMEGMRMRGKGAGETKGSEGREEKGGEGNYLNLNLYLNHPGGRAVG